MATLTNTQISVTYVGLLKTSANTILTSTAQQITDGSGNNSIIFLSTAGVGIGGAAASGKELDVTGNVLVTGDLQVDNINIDGNTISSTAGTDLNITPLAGQQIVLDGTIVIDAGVVTGATSITSTSFVGELTGNASTSTKIASITNSNIVQLTSSQTLTNKTIDVDNNTVSNIEVDNFKASAIVIESEGIGSNDNDTTLPTSAAVKDYVDGQVTAQDLDFAGDSNTGSVDLDSQTFTIAGTTNEIETSASGQTLTVGLPNSVTITTDIGSPIFSTGEGVNNKIFFLGNYGNWRINISDSANQLVIHSESLATDYFTVIGGGGIKLNAYGSGNKTGTVAKNLAVDSSGNIIETDGGVVDGSGTANDVAMWSDANTLTDAPIAISGNNATFANRVSAGESFNSVKDGADTVADGPFFALKNAAGTRQYLNQLDASNNIDYWYYNGSTWTQTISLLTDGGATFAGNVTLSSGFVNLPAGTETDPSLIFAGDDDTGLWHPASNTLAFSTFGNERMRIDSSGLVRFTVNSGTAAAIDIGYVSSARTIRAVETGGGNARPLTLLAQNFTFKDDSATRMVIDSSGHVGIGVVPNAPAGNIQLDVGDNGCGMTSRQNNEIVLQANANYDTYAQAGKPATRLNLTNTGDFHFLNAPAGAAVGDTITFTERMRIDSSGNLGINETSPSSYFTTDLVVKAKADLGGITIRSNATSHNNYLMFADGTSGNEAYRGYINYDHTNDKLNFASAATLALTIDSSQRLGVGTTTPNEKLVVGTTGGTQNIEISNSYIQSFNRSGSPGYAALGFYGSSYVFNVGNVGIGSTGETYGADKLTIKGSNKAISSSPGGNLAVFTSDSVAADKGGSIVLGGTYTGTTPYQFAGIAGLKDNSTAGQAGGYLAFYTTNQSNASPEKMRITSGGDVLVQATSTSGNGLSIRPNATAGTVQQVFNRASTTSDSYVFDFQNGGTTVGFIRYDNTSTAYSTSSDYRLKENVVEMTGALDRVGQLKPSRFNFIGEEKTVDGFLAHEVQDIVPEAISGDKDEVDEDGNEKYQGIDQSKLVPLLVGAIQELKKEIEILKNK
jgi:hypothetical protein